MRIAARAIIIEGDKILVMHRKKQGSKYYTLVGGRVDEDEKVEEAVRREVKEETGMTVSNTRLVFFEDHPEPYNQQYIYLCEVESHGDVTIQDNTDEAMMNRLDMDIHTPVWAEVGSFSKLPFRTPQLQNAIIDGIKNGFPQEAIRI